MYLRCGAGGSTHPSSVGTRAPALKRRGTTFTKIPASGGYWIVIEAVCECRRVPLVPVTWKFQLVARIALLRVEIVSVEVELPLTVLGLNEALAPFGSPLIASLTDPLKPEFQVIVTV